MKLDKFINRPVLSTVISILIVILGAIGLATLPITQYPDIAPPTVSVRATYTGASASTVLNSVIAPLEEQINGVENMMYMTSNASNTGAGDMIGNALATVVGGTHNNYILGALFFIIPFLLTQFMLNRSVSAVFVPICLLTCSALGANPTGLVLLVNAGSLTAFLTPMATPAVPMCMADGGYDLKSLFKSGALITLILPVIYILYTMTVFPAF